MNSKVPNIEARVQSLNAILTEKHERQALNVALKSAKGDWTLALKSLESKLPAATLQRVSLGHTVAVWADDHLPLVKAIADQPELTSMRDVALHFNAKKLLALIEPKAMLAGIAGSSHTDKKKNFAAALQRKLFTAEPSAVLQRMAQDAELPIANKAVRAGVGRFLGNQPDFNIRTTSIHTALKHPEAFKGVADEHHLEVIEHLKTLQRVQAISPGPEVVPVLMRANLNSAVRVAEMPESTFLSAHGATLGEETARQVYTNAINTQIRNEHALMTMREAWRGTGLAIIDGQKPKEARMAKLQAVADANAVPLNLEALFGSIDYCECDDCLSVYSPAAYFVEILQYLRNNNLDPKNPNTGKAGIEGTPLEKLFRRRPDLGCLELTCENTFTVLPYIDLVNEVMESFVVHLDKYEADTNIPKQATLEVFNVLDETSSELLAQPQHVNYQAYCILKDAVYPFTLPYHQPIDAIRIWLKYMGTSRYQLLDTFRTATETMSGQILTPAQQQELKLLHATVLDRSADAEFLGISQEEHIILTREAFWPNTYFDFTLQKVHPASEYQQKIGVKPVPEYYGYLGVGATADMLSIDETKKLGLTFVKKQFLPRTGVQYVDLVELLKTRFINPAFPQGRALAILESIRFSYRFLQTLVDTSSTDPKVRFAKLIDFLDKPQTLVPQLDTLLHPDPCHQQIPEHCLPHADFRSWVYCYFERIGNLIVLESGEGPQLPFEGKLRLFDGNLAGIGALHKDGRITGEDDATIIGNVTSEGQVIGKDGKPFIDKFGVFELRIDNENGELLGLINGRGLIDIAKDALVRWLPVRDTCDLDRVRLTHLDGSALLEDEFDRMQRFIRLWHKLGWTIAETDLALIGASNSANLKMPSGATLLGSPPGSGAILVPGNGNTVGFDVFQPDCSDGGDDDGDCCKPPTHHDDSSCPDIAKMPEEISVSFLHQLVAIRKLLDLTGLPLDKLLSFWANISISGEKSLYARLFLTHNLLGIDKVFKSDANGNYLTQDAKLSDHMPVVMAALKLKADEVAAVVALRKLPDALTLSNVSALYRHSLLAKILHVPVADLDEVFALYADPFKSAEGTLALIHDWGNMEDAGFTFRQLNYLIRDHDDPKHSLAPKKKTILQVSKSLFDGLNAIDNDNQDVPAEKKDDATADLIRAKAGMLFEASVVEKIIGMLEGTSVYTTNAPTNQAIKIPDTDSLAKKLKYSIQKDAKPVPTASIQVTGILTDAEKSQAKALSNDPGWAKAIERVGKQARQFFNDNLAGIFPENSETESNPHLLAGDINIPADPGNPAATDSNTAPNKRFYFLQFCLPFLRLRLAHRLIVSNLAGAAGLATDVADVLLTDILLVGAAKQRAIESLEQIHVKPIAAGKDWKGYLIPAADDAYTFVAQSLKDDDQPPPIVINGQSIPFSVQQEDPTNVWSTDPATPLKLKSGKPYLLEVTGQPATGLMWKTPSLPTSLVPSASLLPDYSSDGTEAAFVELYKAALLVNGFNLSADEVTYWQSHGPDFDGFDFNRITLQHWRRLRAYSCLRDKLPGTETSLLELFKWANKPDAASLSKKIAAVTQWEPSDIAKLITSDHFDLNRPDEFRNEIRLIKLQNALQVAAAIGSDIDSLFRWANPVSRFTVCRQIAEEIRAALRARYDKDDWEQVVKPLYDQLRENQKQALIGYMLVQQDLIDWGVVDSDSLFEFFLIDVQMDACMETSRLKQAISTVQLFVQRCLLGLEGKYGVSSEVLSRGRWDWMQKYRVWEANRKVFLYPENWIKSELRDDKSPFYKELESELLQKDINPQTVEDALKNFLFKVDEVANLMVVGLHFEQSTDSGGNFIFDNSGNPAYIRLHIFGRTRNAPFLFFYRYFHRSENNWYPWERMQVDIPSYDAEGEASAQTTGNGAYVIPVVFNNRLLVFFPQFVRKTLPNPSVGVKTFKVIGDETASKPIECWEIKMAWTEYRNKKWTQKQVSSEAIYTHDSNRQVTLSGNINRYNFTPRIVASSDADVSIEVYLNPKLGFGKVDFTENIGKFDFIGSQIFLNSTSSSVFGTVSTDLFKTFPTDFHRYQDQTIHSLQAVGVNTARLLMKTEPYFGLENSSATANIDGNELKFSHAFSHELLGKFTGGGLDDLFEYYSKIISDDVNAVARKSEAFGGDAQPIAYHELKRPYSLYNWEAAFHTPMLLVDRLLAAQQFDQALKMCQYVLNPYSSGTDSSRFWQFPPFKELDATNVLELLFLGLLPNQPDKQTNEWRDKPFLPHVVARSRPSAYMKWAAIKYIEILIAYGDYYFRQNTLETIPLAIQCYVLASHMYGSNGQRIPKRGKFLPQTYNSLLNKWDAFGNALVELELVFPFSNQTPLPIGTSNDLVGLGNVFGFASTLYFCIPDNPQLRSLRDTIEDRFFKIRHCEDIDGIVRHLPLFEPPIDPALLVQATAQGLSLSSVLNEMNSPMPNYRFAYLLQKAFELCSEVKSLGNSFLSAKEKCDAETLSQLRARHESSIYNLIMEVKKLQLEEAGKALDALKQNRRGPVNRLQHYLKLIGDSSSIPDEDAEFKEISDQIEQPVDESGLKLVAYEKEELDKAIRVAERQIDIGRIESIASILHALPLVSADVKPIGIGVGLGWGGSNLGNAMQAAARWMQTDTNQLQFEGSNAGRKAGFLRQLQDRVLQANSAGYEIKNIDKQILTQQIRINITSQEISNQQKQIDNAVEVEEFLRNKYTNKDLYLWMDSQMRILFYQAYNLAYDLAKRAEKVFRFERGQSTLNFIQYGFWDAKYDGLYSGERLYIGLKQLESAFQEKRGHDFEVSKSISLRQVNPLALIQFKETGACEFYLPEVLFDMDFPGHYLRRLKSVSLRVPCVLGAHTSLNCTLRLLEHKFRINAIAEGKGDYPEQTDQTDERFSTVNVPINSIAVSSLENENGVFELNFHDERYLPFEGAGAISRWRIELPNKFRQFDYDTITDVIMRLRYTAVDGGDKLKVPASDAVQEYIKSVEELSRDEGLFAVFDLKNDFPNEWYEANHPPVGATERSLAISKINEKLPVYTKGRGEKDLLAKNVYLFISGYTSDAQGKRKPAAIPLSAIGVAQGGFDLSFTPGKVAGTMSSFVANDIDAPMGDLTIKIQDTKTIIDKMWLVERYVLA